MGAKKISDLQHVTSLQNNDLFEVSQYNGAFSSKKVSLKEISNFNKKFLVNGDLFAVGDSITSNGDYANMFSEITGKTLNNYAVGGRGVLRAITNAYENNPKNSSGMVGMWMAGFNDYRRNGGVQQTKNKCECALKSFVVNSFIHNAVAASGAIKTGAWINLGTGLIGDLAGHIGGNAVFTNSVGATIATTFNGQTIAVGVWGVDGVTEKGGSVFIDIDGVNYGSYNSNGKTDAVSDGADPGTRIQDVIVIKNLPSGSHTITLTVSAITPGGYFYVDYFATLKSPQNCPSVLVYDIPKMNNIGYATTPANATDLIFNAADSIQHGVINFFDEYPVIRISTNDYYDISTGLSVDNIHPNEIGDGQILAATLANLSQSPVLVGDPIQNQNASAQTADYWINGQARSRIVRIGNSFVYESAGTMQICVNRDPDTGVTIDASKPSPIVFLQSLAGNANLQFLIDDPLNGLTSVFKINNEGDIEQATGRWLYVSGGKENIDGSVRIGLDTGNFVWQKRILGVWTTQPF